MAFSLKLFVMIFLSTWTVATMVTATPRPLSSTTSNSTLAPRLRSDDNNNNKCWETLLELQSCTGEVILFFLNGETYLGSGCCHALLNIAQECWPDMLSTLGLTKQEGDILRGYCDGAPSIKESLAPSVTTSDASHDPMSNNSNHLSLNA